MTEFKLSDKRAEGFNYNETIVYAEEDVKEFIRLLKEAKKDKKYELETDIGIIFNVELFFEDLDKLAGEQLK